jgi:hypothetical protein
MGALKVASIAGGVVGVSGLIYWLSKRKAKASVIDPTTGALEPTPSGLVIDGGFNPDPMGRIDDFGAGPGLVSTPGLVMAPDTAQAADIGSDVLIGIASTPGITLPTLTAAAVTESMKMSLAEHPAFSQSSQARILGRSHDEVAQMMERGADILRRSPPRCGGGDGRWDVEARLFGLMMRWRSLRPGGAADELLAPSQRKDVVTDYARINRQVKGGAITPVC